MQLSERVSRYYAPVVHLTALTTGLVWYFLLGASAHDAMVIAISVLIITCPCALALAVPTVQAMASGAFFRAGLFLNNAAGMEKLGEIDTVVFDKTGTLTLPEPRVSQPRRHRARPAPTGRAAGALQPSSAGAGAGAFRRRRRAAGRRDRDRRARRLGAL